MRRHWLEIVLACILVVALGGPVAAYAMSPRKSEPPIPQEALECPPTEIWNGSRPGNVMVIQSRKPGTDDIRLALFARTGPLYGRMMVVEGVVLADNECDAVPGLGAYLDESSVDDTEEPPKDIAPLSPTDCLKDPHQTPLECYECLVGLGVDHGLARAQCFDVPGTVPGVGATRVSTIIDCGPGSSCLECCERERLVCRLNCIIYRGEAECYWDCDAAAAECRNNC
jgi:hypothetical protein